MDKTRKRTFGLLLSMCVMAFVGATRTSGFESVRMVQIISLFVSGMCAGAALMLFKKSRNS